MNYDQARQLGPESEAPGKWNWTTMNDGVVRTASPCFYPDIDWDARRSLAGPETLGGRPRCDHDTREEAERHYWDDQVAHIRIQPIDYASVRELRRCDVGGCADWERFRAQWPGGYVVDSLCDVHRSSAPTIHPFSSGMAVIHS